MEKVIYLAGGCFWGVSEYFSRLKGINKVTCGYANGKGNNPTYEQVKSQKTGHAETVEVFYNDEEISLLKIIDHFLRFVDPYSLNKQGEDEGIQYRSGIYYIDKDEEWIIRHYLNSKLDKDYKIEIKPLDNFFKAEEYHQDYLKKNPHGYCHVNLFLIRDDEKK